VVEKVTEIDKYFGSLLQKALGMDRDACVSAGKYAERLRFRLGWTYKDMLESAEKVGIDAATFDAIMEEADRWQSSQPVYKEEPRIRE
jgi:hypothetical protein